ncbi:hypothetical protein L5515_016692 [Caenorhabditis briggsae]|uniref:Uncharacterized protein n=1 Tax=Caenorhabditis briggsae TaxID=6238 RepID=A0AAE9F6P9_CAEBR|nr:hypothetical protein L5515_016692 [Caenorhabditis briggsae]
MVFPQVTKDLQKEGHPRRLQSSAGQHQALIMQPLVVQHYAQNVHTEVQLGLAPPLSGGGSTGGGSGGGFFGSGLFRTSGRPPSSSNRPRAYSMLPLTSSISQEEKANMSSNTKKHSNRSHKRYYPLSQEDTLELLLLLNQVFIASDANIVRKMATATRGACPPPLRRPSRSVCEVLNTMAPLNVCNRNAVNANRRYSTLVTVSERVVLRSVFEIILTMSFWSTVFVSWALRSVRESLIQVDPLAAALAHQARKANAAVPAVSRTPLLLQFTPFGPPPSAYRKLDKSALICNMF